jgi:hypothetical protein
LKNLKLSNVNFYDDNGIKMEYNLIYDNYGQENGQKKYKTPKDYVVHKALRHLVVYMLGDEGGVQRSLQKVKGISGAKKERPYACVVQPHVRP